MPRFPIHSLKIRMTSQPSNEYEQTTLSYLLSVKYPKVNWLHLSEQHFSLPPCYHRFVDSSVYGLFRFFLEAIQISYQGERPR